ncbi:N-acetylmuramic acid 6-phosphate etherase [Azotosporobacter soli]|uniref:N-acetylmuramic acid 6-phosphate etherase n=1 Tax=Azotosporobacter soli TaxID=3055040 RepID=UPI0031FF15C9
MTFHLDSLLTERCNPNTSDIDQLSSLEILQRIHEEDLQVASAITPLLPKIAVAVDWISAAFRQGGRLFYLGAGTSGRLGILDAVECPPTYGTPPEMVQGIIAGGESAVFRSVENAEDSPHLAESDLAKRGLTSADIVVGIAASGRTPYVIGGLTYARSLGCRTIALACTPEPLIGEHADLSLAVLSGPEVVTGSTRMKAGTVQKMVLNMFTTAAMIRLGKVYGNLMVDVAASNEKLQHRVRRIVSLATGENVERVEAAVSTANGSAKLAIVMLLGNLSAEAAQARLSAADGFVAKALQTGG